MRYFKSYSFIIGLICCLVSVASSAVGQAKVNNEELVKAAILDYVEGVYNLDTARIYKSVHPTLAKRGTAYNTRKAAYSPILEMSFEQLIALTKSWNKDGNRANDSSPRTIEIYEVQDKTASAKVTAAWGTDYFHLANIDGRWWIMNVLWQSLPPSQIE